MYFSVVHAIDTVIYSKKTIFKCEIVLFFSVQMFKQDFSTGFYFAGIHIFNLIIKYKQLGQKSSKGNL